MTAVPFFISTKRQNYKSLKYISHQNRTKEVEVNAKKHKTPQNKKKMHRKRVASICVRKKFFLIMQ